MYKQKVVLGVAPTKRSFLSMEEAKRQKDKFMASLTEEMLDYAIQGPFEYGEAVQRVKRLGAKTGKSKMLARKIPVSGHLYWR